MQDCIYTYTHTKWRTGNEVCRVVYIHIHTQNGGLGMKCTGLYIYIYTQDGTGISKASLCLLVYYSSIHKI